MTDWPETVTFRALAGDGPIWLQLTANPNSAGPDFPLDKGKLITVEDGWAQLRTEQDEWHDMTVVFGEEGRDYEEYEEHQDLKFGTDGTLIFEPTERSLTWHVPPGTRHLSAHRRPFPRSSPAEWGSDNPVEQWLIVVT